MAGEGIALKTRSTFGQSCRSLPFVAAFIVACGAGTGGGTAPGVQAAGAGQGAGAAGVVMASAGSDGGSFAGGGSGGQPSSGTGGSGGAGASGTGIADMRGAGAGGLALSGGAGAGGVALSGGAGFGGSTQSGAGGVSAAGMLENSLGMKFVAVAGTRVLVSIWETRVQDYQAFADATGAEVPHPEFPEAALQPKAAISRAQAEAFATWLTQKEQAGARLPATAKYRLPADAEWDAAVEVAKSTYPWGATFPPPNDFANYGISQDGVQYTAPVGSFPANEQGLYDTAGNLWEWIGEPCQKDGAYLVRGAAWNAAGESYMQRSFHYCFGTDLIAHHNVGFRLVLEGMP